MIVDEILLMSIYFIVYTLLISVIVYFIPKDSKIKRLIILLLILSDISYLFYIFIDLGIKESIPFLCDLIAISGFAFLGLVTLSFLFDIIKCAYDYVMKGR